MSWLFSQALVAEYSAGTCSDGEPSAQSSSTPMPQAYCAPDKMTGFSRLSRFGMTFAPLTGDLGEDVLTSFLAGFPVRTSALPERAQDSAESVPDSGPKWLASWAKYDPGSCSWKTAQLSFLEDLGASSVTWPRSGLMRRGECYPLRTVARITSESGFGSLLPTPVASDTGSRSAPYAQGGTPLSLAVKAWPTPQASDNRPRATAVSHQRRVEKGKQVSLSAAVKFTTPTAHNAKEGAYPSEWDRNTPTLATQAGGPLNPTWVEWLMGWPLGWTDLQPLATDKFQEWQQQHSPNSAEPWSNAA